MHTISRFLPRRNFRTFGLLPLIYFFLVGTLFLTPQQTVADDAPGDISHHDEAEELHHEAGAMQAMTEAHHHQGKGLHMKWTEKRTVASGDEERAAQIVDALKAALKKYQDYRVAMNEGFEPFHPEIAQPHYHFTSKWRGFKAVFRFNPAEPTSLLYKKTATGYELEGAMYTAPKRMDEDGLNKRVPLSIAQWHAHVNLCFPRKGAMATIDRTRFGFKGSIATEDECDKAGGKFSSQIFGWMLHVYPFEESPDKIWTH
jgi:hypothetical protein